MRHNSQNDLTQNRIYWYVAHARKKREIEILSWLDFLIKPSEIRLWAAFIFFEKETQAKENKKQKQRLHMFVWFGRRKERKQGHWKFVHSEFIAIIKIIFEDLFSLEIRYVIIIWCHAWLHLYTSNACRHIHVNTRLSGRDRKTATCVNVRRLNDSWFMERCPTLRIYDLTVLPPANYFCGTDFFSTWLDIIY